MQIRSVERRHLMWAALVVMGSAWLTAGVSSQAAPPQGAPASQAAAAPANARTYVGSQACQKCHAATYERWSKTRMANVVTDPRVPPDVIIPDLSKPAPLVTFTRNDIAFVYGTRWKQRYFKKVGDDYFPLGAQWDVQNRVWRPYLV